LANTPGHWYWSESLLSKRRRCDISSCTGCVFSESESGAIFILSLGYLRKSHFYLRRGSTTTALALRVAFLVLSAAVQSSGRLRRESPGRPHRTGGRRFLLRVELGVESVVFGRRSRGGPGDDLALPGGPGGRAVGKAASRRPRRLRVQFVFGILELATYRLGEKSLRYGARFFTNQAFIRIKLVSREPLSLLKVPHSTNLSLPGGWLPKWWLESWCWTKSSRPSP
jgi:hypothetical protein